MAFATMFKEEETMKRLALVLLLAVLPVAGSSSAQQQVEAKGLRSKMGLESMVSGYLVELNGKYKLRATELTFEPGGYVGEHHHVGPGIRYVASGELTFVQEGKTTIYKTGDYFYESGDINHSGTNKTSSPVVLVVFEILPADWTGRGTALPPKSR